MSTFKTRRDATAYLRALGIVLADNALAELASEGRGPKYARINGRAVYKDEWLQEWLEQQQASALPARRRQVRA